MQLARKSLLLASTLLAACASGGGQAGLEDSRDPERISRQELQSQPTGNAYEAVERLRPNWLRSRSGTSAGGAAGSTHLPAVFVDDLYFGTLESLSHFNLDGIREMRFWSAPDATTRFGTGYLGGIIQLIMMRSSLRSALALDF